MRIFTAHAGPHRDPEDLLLVPERASLVAMVVPLPWLLWHRCWMAAAAYCIVALAIGLLATPSIAVWLAAGAHILIGLSAQDIRRLHLAAVGSPTIAVVAGRDRDAALFRLLAERRDLTRVELR
ncbi:DUF2628 domain-containing protein [Humitalea sp. 24SJ18S-53]|uniref:DUF2628 domain-containing protein n=1 Tax=Humitalea sp. 24SJ18S-53 TaxID=3422307 RepID=UPI003D667CF4